MLSIRGKKILLSLHIILVSLWLGGLGLVLFLQIFKHAQFSAVHYRIIDRLIFEIFDVIIMNISALVALSGLLFSLFTAWGFFKFRWIVFKWLAVIIVALFLMFWSAPAINGMAALSDIYENAAPGQAEYLSFEGQVVWYSLLQLIALIVVVSVSVFKPWGTRKQKFRLKRRSVLISGSLIGMILILSMLMQYLQLQQYRTMPVKPIDLTGLNDGIYQGKADYGFDYQVEVEIRNQQIIEIKVLNNRDSFYARLAEGIMKKIVVVLILSLFAAAAVVHAQETDDEDWLKELGLEEEGQAHAAPREEAPAPRPPPTAARALIAIR